MEKYIEIIKLLERIFGKSAVSKSIGTRTNVTRFPKGPQGLDPTTRHFDVEATAQKTPELVDTIKNSVGDRMGDLTKMNDQEFLTYKQNVQRLADHVDPPSADVIAAGSKQQVTGEGLEKLIDEQGLVASPKTPLGKIQFGNKRAEYEMNKIIKESDLDSLLKGIGKDQLSEIRLHNEGLVRAVTRQILSEDIKAGKIKSLTLDDLGTSREPIDYFRKIYGENALEQLDSLTADFNRLNTEQEAAKLARSKFKFEPDETRVKGSTSYEELEKNIKNPEQTKKAKVSDFKAEATKRTSIDDLIDEYNANQDKLKLTDDEGGTLITYPEYNKLKDRNDEIAKALEEKGISSAIEEEVKTEGIIIPFKKKITEPENKADGGSIGLDYLMGFNNKPNYKKGGRVGYADGGTEPSFYDYFSSADKTKPISYGDKTYNPISSYQGKDYGIGLNRWTAKPMYASNFNPNNRFDLYGNVDPFLPFGYEGNAFYLNELPEDFFSTGMSTPTTTEIPTVDPFSGQQVSAQDQALFNTIEPILNEKPPTVLDTYEKALAWDKQQNEKIYNAQKSFNDLLFPQQELPTVAPIPNKPIDPSMWQQFSNYIKTNAGIPAITELEVQNYMDPQKGYTDTAEGFASDIRHSTATSQVRDRIADFLTGNANSIDSNYQPGSRAKFLGALGANLFGAIREPDLLNFKNPSARAAAVEDVKANYRGAPIFGTPTVPYGQTVSQTYSQLQNKNDPILKTLGENLNNLSYEDIKNIRNTKRQDLVSAATQTMKNGGSIGLDYLMGMDNRPKYASGGGVKKILDLIAKANKELKGKKSMEGVNPKTGEVTIPKEPIKTARTTADIEKEIDELSTTPITTLEKKRKYNDLHSEFINSLDPRKQKKALDYRRKSLDMENRLLLKAEEQGLDFDTFEKLRQGLYGPRKQQTLNYIKTGKVNIEPVKPATTFEEVQNRYKTAAKAADEIFPDYNQPKTAANSLAEVMAEQKYGKVFDEISGDKQSELYSEAYDYITSVNKLPKVSPERVPPEVLQNKMNEVLNSYDKSMFIKNDQGMVDVANPENIAKMEELLRKDHPELHNQLKKLADDVNQKETLLDFDVTGRKPNKDGGLNYLLGL